MPLNLAKTYSDLLELGFMDEGQRKSSLQRIFKRDIEDNATFNFRGKPIRPFKGEEPNMQNLFTHLTCEEIEVEEENGNKYKRRIFEMARSQRLHWIRFHIDDQGHDNIEVFSVIERDNRKKKDVTKTYIYDKTQEYIVILEVQRSGQDYYLLTAYHLNRPGGKESIQKKLKKKLPIVH